LPEDALVVGQHPALWFRELDGSLITGQQNFSSTETALKVMEASDD
jgi:hypothetical protein